MDMIVKCLRPSPLDLKGGKQFNDGTALKLDLVAWILEKRTGCKPACSRSARTLERSEKKGEKKRRRNPERWRRTTNEGHDGGLLGLYSSLHQSTAHKGSPFPQWPP
jgi:hypothetical protein